MEPESQQLAMSTTSETKEELTSQVEIGSDGGASQEDAVATRSITGLPWAAVVLAILSSTFLYSLDNTIMANIRPGIIKSLGHIEMLPWMTVAYPLGEVGSCPFWYVLVMDHGSTIANCY